jgi:hypothetical protein
MVIGSWGGERFFSSDRRTVTEEGVETVMKVFLRHYCNRAVDEAAIVPAELGPRESPGTPDARSALEAVCDEEQLDSVMQAGDEFRG